MLGSRMLGSRMLGWLEPGPEVERRAGGILLPLR